MDATFTICTTNYLINALTLRDSFLFFNPDDHFFFCVPDQLDDDQKEALNSVGIEPYQIIEVDQLNLSCFPNLCKHYNLIELCSALKPFFAHYLLQKYPDCFRLCYFDCDILIFDSIVYLKDKLWSCDILLTPHILSEHSVEDRDMETHILNAGLYNAGFFGLNQSDNANRMLLWWQDRVTTHGYVNFMRGMYADQLWLNFVPLFFQNVRIETHHGCNVAYWNLHERTLDVEGDSFRVNQEYALLFFHFSGYQLNTDVLSKYSKPVHINNDRVLALVCERYNQMRAKYQYWFLKRKPNPYDKSRPVWIEFVRGWLVVLLNKGMENLGT